MSDNQKDKKLGIHLFIGAVGLVSVAGLVIGIIAYDKSKNSDSNGNNTISTTTPTFTTVVSGAISTEVLNIVKPSARNGVAESTTVYTLPTSAGKAGQVITLGADAKKAVWASSGASSVSGPVTSIVGSIATFEDITGNKLASSANLSVDQEKLTIGVSVFHNQEQEYERWDIKEYTAITGPVTISDYRPVVVVTNNSTPAGDLKLTLSTPTTSDIGKVITIFNRGNTTTPDAGSTLTIETKNIAGGTADKTIASGNGVKIIAVTTAEAGWCVI